MALGLPERDGGERTAIIKYDGRAGRIFRVDRTQADGSWVTNNVEITPVFQAIMDLENIELGWLYFPTNDAPDIVVSKYGTPLPEKPSKNHRAGYRLHMMLGKQAGGDVREMAANAGVSIKGMDALHDAYLAGVKTNPGKLPVVQLGGTTAVSSSGKGPDGRPVSSTNYMPNWVITGWKDRPAELAPGGHAAAPAQPATPEPEPQPLALASVDDDF